MKYKQKVGIRYKKVYLAKSFRKEPTKAEEIFWQAVRNRRFGNLKFRRQYIILNFIIDFYCHELKLAIEIDGKIHEKQKIRDKLRELLIKKKKDIKFVRIKNKDIIEDIDQVLNNLQKIINN